MRPELLQHAAAQGGLVSRRQAKLCGYSERELKTLTGARGGWAVVRRGVYCERTLWEHSDEDGRYALRVRAALLAATKPALPSHSSAAVLLGLPMRPRWQELVHVTRPGVHGCRTEGGVKHHLARYSDDDVVTVGATPCLAPARTAVDIAREFGFEDGVVTADAALRAGASKAELEAAVAGMWCWPNVTRARAAVAAAAPGAESIGETLLRLLVVELGLGIPETQFEVVADGRRAVVDLRLRRQFFEFDGHVKYVGRESGGVSDRAPEEVVWAEKQREDWLRGQGYGMSRVVWRDLLGHARERTKARLTADIRRSDELYGTL